MITWDDAFVTTKDFSRKEAEKTKGVRRHSVGWVVAENDEGIVLSTDYYEEEKPEFNTKMFIPWGWIEHYWEYTL